jgi:hypothetical protein
MTNPRHGILGTRSYRTKKESAAFIYLRLSKAQLVAKIFRPRCL